MPSDEYARTLALHSLVTGAHWAVSGDPLRFNADAEIVLGQMLRLEFATPLGLELRSKIVEESRRTHLWNNIYRMHQLAAQRGVAVSSGTHIGPGVHAMSPQARYRRYSTIDIKYGYWVPSDEGGAPERVWVATQVAASGVDELAALTRAVAGAIERLNTINIQ